MKRPNLFRLVTVGGFAVLALPGTAISGDGGWMTDAVTSCEI